MKIHTFQSFILCLMLITIHTIANAEDKKKRVLWEKIPIPIFVNVNEERIIHFPTDVRYWVPEYLSSKISILSAKGVLYITAHEPIKKTRIRIQTLDSHKVYLVDLVAEAGQMVAPELIIMDKDYIENQSVSTPIKPKPADWYVRLTRFAAQSLYAAEHLMPVDDEITRVNINSVNTVPLVRGGDIEAIPVASWSGGGFYITAIRLRNLSDKKITIVYNKSSITLLKERFFAIDSDLRGTWLSASIQHHYLGALGHKSQEDITSLYLVSTHTFRESL